MRAFSRAVAGVSENAHQDIDTDLHGEGRAILKFFFC